MAWRGTPVVAGVLVGGLAVLGVQVAGDILWGTSDAVARPPSTLLFLAQLAAWVCGAALAPKVATFLASGTQKAGLLAGGVLFAGAAINLATYHFPWWTVAGIVLLMPLATRAAVGWPRYPR